MKDVVFVTGNQNKADYLARLVGFPIEHKSFEIEEIQSSDIDMVTTHKAKQAYALANRPVLVEDVALSFEALDGLPGPFVKFFEQINDGLEKMCRMLDGFDNRRAQATCVFGYYDGTNLTLLRGQLDGEIVDSPRGSNGFGWDKIFCVDGYGGRTRAELSNEEYDELYPTIRPINALKELLYE